MSQSLLLPLFEWLQALCLEAAHSLAAERCSSAAWNHRHAEYTALCWTRAFFRNIIFSHPRILA